MKTFQFQLCIWIVCFSLIGSQGITQEMLRESSESEKARQQLLMLLSGEWISRGLYTATQLDIASHLQTGSKQIEELAMLTKSNPEALYRLLHLLASLGVFEEVAPREFCNTEMSRQLIASNPEGLHALSLFYGEDIHHALDKLNDCVQTGTPAFELNFQQPVFTYFKAHPERATVFQQAMKEKSRAVIASCLSTYDFSSFGSVCDVGGGYGQFIQAILTRYPAILGSVLELPDVIEKIRQQASYENNRLEIVEGDFFDAVPKDHDVYLLKSVIHDWDDVRAEKILSNCKHAMRPDSRLLIVETVLQPKDQSIYANCMDVLMLAITGGKERSLADFERLIEKSGLILKRIYPTSTEFSILEVHMK